MKAGHGDTTKTADRIPSGLLQVRVVNGVLYVYTGK